MGKFWWGKEEAKKLNGWTGATWRKASCAIRRSSAFILWSTESLRSIRLTHPWCHSALWPGKLKPLTQSALYRTSSPEKGPGEMESSLKQTPEATKELTRSLQWPVKRKKIRNPFFIIWIRMQGTHCLQWAHFINMLAQTWFEQQCRLGGNLMFYFIVCN